MIVFAVRLGKFGLLVCEADGAISAANKVL